MKKTPKIIINLLIAPIIGCLLLIGVFSIPTDNINKHVEESAQILVEEGGTYNAFYWCTSTLDIYSDALMLLEVSYDGNESSIEKAMASYRYDYGDDVMDDMDSLERLFVNDEKPNNKLSYARYWHGYLVTLKPLLYFFNYQTIRVINLIIELLLTIFICILMCRYNLKKYIISYLILFLMLNPYVLGFNFENATCFYVYNIGIILLLLFRDKLNEYAYLIFLNLGILTSFLDLLTWPVATIGIPLLFYCVLSTKSGSNTKFIDILKLCVCWTIGYVFMWASKWILAQIITGDSVINNAFNQILIRSSNESGDGSKYSFITCIINNYYLYLRTPITFVMLVYLVYLIILFFKKYKKNRINISELLIYIFISALPILWFSVTLNHSYAHCAKFVNRDTIVTWMAAMFYLITFNNQTTNE